MSGAKAVVDVERREQVVVDRRALRRLERSLARNVLRRVRIRAEIMVVRDILLKDHHEMLDRGRRADAAIVAVVRLRRRDGERCRQTAGNDWMPHMSLPMMSLEGGNPRKVALGG